MKTRRILLLALWCAGQVVAAEPEVRTPAAGGAVEKLLFHTDWKGERIALPPTFAPTMKLKGIEEIRFAPGMFRAQADSFFSYAFVFSVAKEQELTEEVIQREMITYYRGLSESVSRGKGQTADTSKFTFAMKRSKQAEGVPAQVGDAAQVAQYTGDLAWVEPFATGKEQVLHFELQAWSAARTGRNYLFVCVSPKPSGDNAAIWTELRKLRRSFEFVAMPGN